MTIHPDRQPNSEQDVLTPVEVSSLQGAVLNIDAWYNGLIEQVRELSRRKNIEFSVMMYAVVLFLLLGCSATTKESTNVQTITIPPSPTQPATSETESPPTPEVITVTSSHYGPAFQDIGQAFDWQYIADIFANYSHGMLGEKTKVFWNAEQPPAGKLFNDIVVSELLGTTQYIPGTSITPEMNIPTPSREKGATVYFTISADQINNWIMSDPQMQQFLQRLKEEESKARTNGNYSGKDSLPSNVSTRILGIDEAVTLSGDVQQIGVQFEVVFNYYPGNNQLNEAAIFRISLVADRPADGSDDFELQASKVEVLSWFEDLATQRAAIADQQQEHSNLGQGVEYAYNAITQNVRGENVQVGFGRPEGTNGVSAFPPIDFLDISGQIDLPVGVGVGDQELALQIKPETYINWILEDATLSTYIGTNFPDQPITINVSRDLVTLVEYSIAQGETLPAVTYSLPLELVFESEKLDVILHITAKPQGEELVVTEHTLDAFGSDGKQILQ